MIFAERENIVGTLAQDLGVHCFLLALFLPQMPPEKGST